MTLGDEWLHISGDEKPKKDNRRASLKTYSYTTDKDKLKIEKCIEQLQLNGIDITQNYEDWIKIGFALVPLGDDGRAYFHQISELFPNYKYAETEEKFSNFKKTYDGRTTISTIFYYFKLAGVDIRQAGEDAGVKTNFPYEVFHPELRETILKANECLNINIDYLSTAILTVVSGLIGNTYSVRVKDSWKEPSIIFSAIVGTSGYGKSPALEFAMKPITKMQVESFDKYKLAKSEWDQAVEKRKEDKSASPPGDHPILKQIFFSDATPEAINDIHNNNENGLILYRDELSAWFNSFNQYRKGADEEFWLSVFSNKISTINRVSKPPIIIEKPHICVLGGIQPKLIRDLAQGSRLDNGFLYRILFAYPEHKQKLLWNEKKMPDKLVNKYWSAIHAIYQNIYCGGMDAKAIPFDDQAREFYINFYNQTAEAMYTERDDGKEAMYSKMISILPRLALALEVVNSVYDGQVIIDSVSENSVKGAYELIEYFKRSFYRIYSIINPDLPDLVFEVADMVREGKSYSAIAKELDISKGTISKWKNKYHELF